MLVFFPLEEEKIKKLRSKHGWFVLCTLGSTMREVVEVLLRELVCWNSMLIMCRVLYHLLPWTSCYEQNHKPCLISTLISPTTQTKNQITSSLVGTIPLFQITMAITITEIGSTAAVLQDQEQHQEVFSLGWKRWTKTQASARLRCGGA